MSTPGLRHIVLFHLNPETFNQSEAEKFLAVMRGSVPGLLSIEFGPKTVTPFEGYIDRSGAYTHALTSQHKDAAALGVYTSHPDHVVLATYLRSHAVSPPLAIDFLLSGL